MDTRENNIKKILKGKKYPLSSVDLKNLSEKTGYSQGDIEYMFQKMNKDLQYNNKYAKGGGVGEWSNGFNYGSLALKNTNIYIQDNGGKVNRGRYDIYAKTPQTNLLNSFNDLEEAKKYGYDYSTKYAKGSTVKGKMAKPMFKIGDRVKIASDNDNDNYNKFRGKTLTITHVATNKEQHRGYDSGMEGMALYDFKGVPFSLYEYELEPKFAKGSTVKGFGDTKNLIGKQVNVDFRRGAIGTVIDYDNEWVTVDYPTLGFAEKVKLKTEQVTLVGKYAKGSTIEGGEVGDKNELDNEIFLSLLKIYKSEGNSGKDLFSFSEYKLGKILSENAFDRIKSGKSPLGKFGLYGGGLGKYYALDIANGDFYKRIRGEKMAKGGGVEKENAEMVLNNNKQIAHHTKELQSALKGKKVPAWVVAKVNRSASDLSDATHYLEGSKYAKGGNMKGLCYTIGGL